MRDLGTSTVDGAAAFERHRAQSTGDYVDPRDNMPTLAECDRDEAEAELYDFGGGLTDTFLGSTS